MKKINPETSTFYKLLIGGAIIIPILILCYTQWNENSKDEEYSQTFNFKIDKKETTKKVIENYTLNNPQSISSVFDNDKIIKDLGLDVNDLKSADGKLNLSKGDGYPSGFPNGSEGQLYYYAGKLSSYLNKSSQAEKVAKYIEKSYKKKLQVWDANEYPPAWILKNNPHLWKYINDL
jgi:hypothetical protein